MHQQKRVWSRQAALAVHPLPALLPVLRCRCHLFLMSLFSAAQQIDIGHFETIIT